MQVEDALAGSGADVRDEPPRVETLGIRHARCQGTHVGKGLRTDDVGHRSNVIDRDDQQVGRGRRVDVAECQRMLRTIDHVGGDVPRRDLAEEAVGAQPLVRPILAKRVLKASSL